MIKNNVINIYREIRAHLIYGGFLSSPLWRELWEEQLEGNSIPPQSPPYLWWLRGALGEGLKNKAKRVMPLTYFILKFWFRIESKRGIRLSSAVYPSTYLYSHSTLRIV
jgi:hypothetical protein